MPDNKRVRQSEETVEGGPKQTSDDDGEIVRFNVGGRSFWTTLGTISPNRFEPENLLYRIYRRALADPGSAKMVNKKEFFIDRDPEPFESLLRYLRTGSAPQCMDEDLVQEAGFYGLHNLLKCVQLNDRGLPTNTARATNKRRHDCVASSVTESELERSVSINEPILLLHITCPLLPDKVPTSLQDLGHAMALSSMRVLFCTTAALEECAVKYGAAGVVPAGAVLGSHSAGLLIHNSRCHTLSFASSSGSSLGAQWFTILKLCNDLFGK